MSFYTPKSSKISLWEPERSRNVKANSSACYGMNFLVQQNFLFGTSYEINTRLTIKRKRFTSKTQSMY